MLILNSRHVSQELNLTSWSSFVGIVKTALHLSIKFKLKNRNSRYGLKACLHFPKFLWCSSWMTFINDPDCNSLGYLSQINSICYENVVFTTASYQKLWAPTFARHCAKDHDKSKNWYAYHHTLYSSNTASSNVHFFRSKQHFLVVKLFNDLEEVKPLFCLQNRFLYYYSRLSIH